jgi:diaminopimelate decarboxylase
MKLLPKLIGFELRDQAWFVENLPLSTIAQQFGTPCYVYSHDALCAAFMAYEKACLRADGSRRARVHFAMKSNSNLAILQLFSQLGAGFDLVSGGELERVVAAGADPALCVFSGVGKSIAEIKRALELGVKCFNVESIPELTRINHIAREMGVIAPISLRVNPDVDAKTHPYISTGLKDNKFGIAYESVLSTYVAAKAMSHCKIIGIDCHIGSQILELQPYLDALDRIFLLIEQLREQGIDIAHLDVGGGLGIDYGGDIAPNITDFANHILQHIEKSGFGYLDLIFEPGRSLVGNAGVLLTKIEYLKPTEAKNFCIVDAAMNDLMRPAMYEAFHHIVPVVLKPIPHQTYDIVGPVCETGDWLGKDRELAVEQDDLLMIMSAGAYGSSMSSNYNTRGRSAEVMVIGDEAFLIRERETVQSLFAGEHLLPKK